MLMLSAGGSLPIGCVSLVSLWKQYHDLDGCRSFGARQVHGLVKLLLESGADVHAKETSGWTALTHATKNGHKDTRALLLKHGAQQ